MKILVKWVLLVVVVLAGSSQLMASELGKFVGNYEINAGESADCPQKMDILQVASSDDHLVVFGNSQEPGRQQHYVKINSGKLKEHFAISDLEIQIKTVFENGSLEKYYRFCSGSVLKKCLAWVVFGSLVADDPEYKQVTVSTESFNFQPTDAAGFPVGVDCKYTKNGPNQVTKILR
jgi:hypothetical protein